MTLITVPVVTTRAATGADERLLRALFAESRDDLFLLDPDVRDALLDMQYRAQRRQMRADHPTAEHLVLVVDGIAVGCVVLDQGCDGVDVFDLAVVWSRRGRGIATGLLSALLADHGSARCQVVSGNRALRDLGAQVGFTVAQVGQSQPRRLNSQ